MKGLTFAAARVVHEHLVREGADVDPWVRRLADKTFVSNDTLLREFPPEYWFASTEISWSLKMFQMVCHGELVYVKRNYDMIMSSFKNLGEPRSRTGIAPFGRTRTNQERLDYFISIAMEYVVTGGHFDMMLFLVEKGWEIPPRLVYFIRHGDTLAMTKWFLAHGSVCDGELYSSILARGDIFVMDWVYGNEPRVELKCWLWYSACEDSSLSGLEWLLIHKCPWDESVFTETVYDFDPKVMEWLFEHKCPWDSSALRAAEESGRIQAVRWLFAHGCTDTTDIYASVMECREADRSRYVNPSSAPWFVADLLRYLLTRRLAKRIALLCVALILLLCARSSKKLVFYSSLRCTDEKLRLTASRPEAM